MIPEDGNLHNSSKKPIGFQGITQHYIPQGGSVQHHVVLDHHKITHTHTHKHQVGKIYKNRVNKEWSLKEEYRRFEIKGEGLHTEWCEETRMVHFGISGVTTWMKRIVILLEHLRINTEQLGY
jgi:hypothetical protein